MKTDYQFPYSKHRLLGVEGFANSVEAVIDCDDYTGRDGERPEDVLHELTPEAIENVHTLYQHFLIAAGILTEATGIEVSPKLASEIMDRFLEGKFYRWPQVTQNNLPWLMARCINNISIVGERLRPAAEITGYTAQFLETYPGIYISQENRVAPWQKSGESLRFGMRLHTVNPPAKLSPGEIGSASLNATQNWLEPRVGRDTVIPEQTDIHNRPAETIEFYLMSSLREKPIYTREMALHLGRFQTRIARISANNRDQSHAQVLRAAREAISRHGKADPEFKALFIERLTRGERE
jgi:hypothetical protein